MSGSEFSEHSAAIWRSRDEERPDRYVIFRKKFELPTDFSRPVRCDIAADSSFELRINGVRIPATQAADMPEDRSYSSLDVSDFVRPGGNVIAVEVHYMGDDFLTRRRGAAFLRAARSDPGRLAENRRRSARPGRTPRGLEVRPRPVGGSPGRGMENRDISTIRYG